MSDDASDGLELDLDAVAPTVHAIRAVLSREEVSEASKRHLIARAYLGAASNNRIELLEYLLSDPVARRHLDVKAVDEDGTPALILAAFTGYGEVVRLLLEHGADINVRDARGWTALMWAFQTNSQFA
jgi:ankyrin repeat protein